MKQQETFIALVNKQLEPFNKTYVDVQGVDDWYMQYVVTPEQECTFINWGVDFLRSKLRLTKKQAEREMQWFILQWGLKSSKVVNNVSSIEEIIKANKKSKA